MKTEIENLSEMSKELSVKSHITDNLLHLFGRFGMGSLLCRLCLEKSGLHIECVSRVFDHVQGCCVLGYGSENKSVT